MKIPLGYLLTQHTNKVRKLEKHCMYLISPPGHGLDGSQMLYRNQDIGSPVEILVFF